MRESLLPRKKILFVIESLTLAGSEKSLIALISNLDSEKYEIELQLFKYGGELEKSIPKNVKLLKPLNYTIYSSESWYSNIKDILSKDNFLYFLAKLKYSLRLKFKKRGVSEISKLYWESISNVFESSSEVYDVAIAFAQGVPTYYVRDKITAKRKIAWVNANMVLKGYNKSYQEKYYKSFDNIITISQGAKEHLMKILPKFINKYMVIPNIIDFNSVSHLASAFSPPMNMHSFRILTVGRLDDGMKGMDITIQSAKLLRDKGVAFHWYILGKGPFEQAMRSYISENNLSEFVHLMGTTDNPYPYFKASDLYVQTSRSEGYGRTIAEARMLNVPIVTTCFDTVYTQMIHEKNGLITEMNPEAVAKGIERMMTDKNLYQSVVEYLKNEPKENTETVKKFDAMIEELL